MAKKEKIDPEQALNKENQHKIAELSEKLETLDEDSEEYNKVLEEINDNLNE